MNTQVYNVQEARAHLSKLLEDVASGTDIIIAKAGKPIARMTGIEVKEQEIHFGVLKGKAKVSEDFDAPLPDDMLSEFETD